MIIMQALGQRQSVLGPNTRKTWLGATSGKCYCYHQCALLGWESMGRIRPGWEMGLVVASITISCLLFWAMQPKMEVLKSSGSRRSIVRPAPFLGGKG